MRKSPDRLGRAAFAICTVLASVQTPGPCRSQAAHGLAIALSHACLRVPAAWRLPFDDYLLVAGGASMVGEVPVSRLSRMAAPGRMREFAGSLRASRRIRTADVWVLGPVVLPAGGPRGLTQRVAATRIGRAPQGLPVIEAWLNMLRRFSGYHLGPDEASGIVY